MLNYSKLLKLRHFSSFNSLVSSISISFIHFFILFLFSLRISSVFKCFGINSSFSIFLLLMIPNHHFFFSSYVWLGHSPSSSIFIISQTSVWTLGIIFSLNCIPFAAVFYLWEDFLESPLFIIKGLPFLSVILRFSKWYFCFFWPTFIFWEVPKWSLLSRFNFRHLKL